MLLRLEGKRRKLAQAERRQDAGGKLKLGGLIVIAGLRLVPPAILLGALLELRERISDRDEVARLRKIGEREFMKRIAARSLAKPSLVQGSPRPPSSGHHEVGGQGQAIAVNANDAP